MIFGNQTITFTRFTESGASDALGNKTLVPSSVVAPNCRHRPLTFTELVEAQLDIATEWWRSTVPVHIYDDTLRDAIMSTPPDSVIEVDSQEYQIEGGVRTHPDAAGIPFKTTIISKKQIG